MDLLYAQLSSQGPVRTNNEDCIAFWQPEDLDAQRSYGALALIADGLGGHGQGEVASQLAVQTALEVFRGLKPDVPPRQALWQLFTAANVAVYDRGMDHRDEARMGTTLTAALFRNDEVTIGHVGDCRAYLIAGGRVQRITGDHSYAAQQVRLGLMSEADALRSELHSMLTRSIGREPVVQVDYFAVPVGRGDRLVLCSDGLYQCVSEEEIGELATHAPPAEACRELIALAEKRGTEDNLSIQIVEIRRVEQLMHYRGLPIYHEPELSMRNEPETGQVLDGRFHILEIISRSGMATIYKVKDVKTGEVLAVKVPFMQYESDPAFYTRFQREEAIGKQLRHPFILRVVPVEEDKSRPYIVMEYLRGQTLRQALRSMERLPVASALEIASHICDALEYLHEHNIIHRDLKPENIMLCDDGSIRVMDFGIAKAAGLRRLTFTGFSSAMGTPDYMAPEQVKGKRGDARTDLYCLGAMLYEMVTGQPPFEGNSPYAIMNARLVSDPIAPRRINPEISPQVEEIILHAMEQQPYNRYPSAKAMKAEIDAPDSVELTGRPERLRPPVAWQGNWRAMRLVVLAVLIPILVFLSALLIFWHPWAR